MRHAGPSGGSARARHLSADSERSVEGQEVDPHPSLVATATYPFGARHLVETDVTQQSKRDSDNLVLLVGRTAWCREWFRQSAFFAEMQVGGIEGACLWRRNQHEALVEDTTGEWAELRQGSKASGGAAACHLGGDSMTNCRQRAVPAPLTTGMSDATG